MPPFYTVFERLSTHFSTILCRAATYVSGERHAATAVEYQLLKMGLNCRQCTLQVTTGSATSRRRHQRHSAFLIATARHTSNCESYLSHTQTCWLELNSAFNTSSLLVALPGCSVRGHRQLCLSGQSPQYTALGTGYTPLLQRLG